MKCRLLFIVCITFLGGLVKAQVNLQTGSATFSLPLFNWQDHKGRLTSVVALNYSSGNGLKVSDVASNVGQGWGLIAGGVVTRMQVGEPDDQVGWNGNGSEHDLTKFPPGYLYATEPAYKGCPEALTKYPIYEAKNQLYTQHNKIAEDKQLDYFSFQFNGKSGLFILDKANGDRGVMLGDSKIKIAFQRDPSLFNQGIRTSITSFTIQDVDGLIYTFSQHGLTKVLETNYSNAGGTERYTQPKFEGNEVYHQSAFENDWYVSPYIIGSWYLTSIKDPLTQRTVALNYTNRSINSRAGEDISYNEEGDYSIISHKKSITRTPDVTAIIYPDGHTVTFNYGAARVDLSGAYALASVAITYQGRTLSHYNFNTTYFLLNRYGTPVSDYQKAVARLCLKSVQKIGVDLKEDTPPYTFDYYLGSSAPDDVVPPPFTPTHDIWGFYNGSNNKGFYDETIAANADVNGLGNNQLKGLCFLNKNIPGTILNPKNGYAKNGLLKQIIYPTGGTLSYAYEQNMGSLNGAYRTVGGVHVAETQSTDGGHSNGCANPITTQYSYVLDHSGNPSSLWGLEVPVNSMSMSSYYKPESQRYKWSLKCAPFGCCYFKYVYPGIMSQQQATSLTDFQRFMEAAAPVLGILSVVSTIMDVATVLMGTGTPLAIVAVVIDIIAGLVTLAITCLKDFSKSTATTVYYNMDLNNISPLPAQFKRVEVTESPGTAGKTIHEFTSDDEYPIWYPTNPVFSAKQRYASWAYGLPKLTVLYDVNGKKIKEVENFYSYDHYTKQNINPYPIKSRSNASGLYTDLVSCKCLVTHSSSQKNTDWADPVQYNDSASYRTGSTNTMKVDFNEYYTGRVHLLYSYERTFKTADPTKYLENRTEYTYNYDKNYEVRSIVNTQSNGDKTYTNIKYSSDYDGGALTSLAQNNIVSLPIGTTTYVSKNNGGYLGQKVTEFAQLSNGDIKPYRTLEIRGDRPMDWTSPLWSNYDGPNGTDYSKFKITQSFTYDAGGNLTGLKDEGGRSVTNIYDYDDKFITASVVNADPATDKCFYTSFETTGLGGWTLSGPNGATPSAAITGSRGFYLFTGSNSLTASALTVSKPYKLSLWATAPVSVSGSAALTVSAPTINGFTYYEYELPPGTSSVSITGSATIDELRLYPKAARMRTVTYDPLIGKTSECDENNRVTYYEYDNLGRLQFIKDESKNVVKVYEYNNVSKQQGCPGVYSNKLTSEIYARNNCGAGYVGGTVTYTVPANRYSSTISQEDADAQVQNEILANGQTYANNNGACLPVYTNTVKTFTDTTEGCPAGYKGGPVTYTVPAGRYTSIISQADADAKAKFDVDANGWAYINNPAHRNCTIDTDPQWSWESGKSYCQNINGQLPAHQFIEEVDLNPNSTSYGQTRWADVGPTSACPANMYYSNATGGPVTKNDCPSGYIGSRVDYVVPPGKYSSSVSQAAANQQALNDFWANGQAYANQHGTCEAAPIYARVEYENVWSGWEGSYGDVVVRFYSDPYYTNQIGVNNYLVNYQIYNECDGTVYNASFHFTGDQVYLATNAHLSYNEWRNDPYQGPGWYLCYINYYAW